MAEKDNIVKCGICLKKLSDPKILPCFHSVCLKCLENIVETNVRSGQFLCPVCQTTVTIPDGGARCFQTNFYIQAEDSGNSELDCDACGRRKSACQKCRQCDQNFCGSCTHIHLRMSSSRDHELHSIVPVEKGQDQVIPFCKNHQSEEVTMICKDCDKFICRICTTALHSDHVQNTLTEEAEEKRKQLRELIDISYNNVTEIEKDMRVVKRQAESKHKYFCEQLIDLRRQRDLIISNINKKFKSLEDKIKQLNDEQLILSNELNENQKVTTSNLKQSIDNAREITETGEDVRLLKNFESLVEKLREIEVSLVPAASGHKLMETVEECTTWLIKLGEQNCDISHT